MTKLKTLAWLGCSLWLMGCQQPPQELQKITGFTQGTTYSISFWSAQPTNIDQLAQLIDDELQRIDQVMSNYRPDSVIEQFNRSPAGTPLNQEIHQLMRRGHQVHQATQGCYDPTSLALFQLWGFSDEDFSIPDGNGKMLTSETAIIISINILDTVKNIPYLGGNS